jgi:hypothetical protein
MLLGWAIVLSFAPSSLVLPAPTRDAHWMLTASIAAAAVPRDLDDEVRASVMACQPPL